MREGRGDEECENMLVNQWSHCSSHNDDNLAMIRMEPRLVLVSSALFRKKIIDLLSGTGVWEERRTELICWCWYVIAGQTSLWFTDDMRHISRLQSYNGQLFFGFIQFSWETEHQRSNWNRRFSRQLLWLSKARNSRRTFIVYWNIGITTW